MNKPEPDAAARARPYRLFQLVFVGDAVIGAVIYLFASEVGGEDAFLVQALEIVGLGLVIAGAVGTLMFAALARGARRDT